jgi:hypothetical protein
VALCVAGTYGIELRLVDAERLAGLGALGLKALLFAATVASLWRVLARAERLELVTWIARRLGRS